jgi:hypothetical protein
MHPTPTIDPLAQFVDAIPVNWPVVIGEAANYRRQDYSPLDCWRFALDRDYARRVRVATPRWEATQHPLERERVALELEMTLLRDKLIGAHPWDRERYTARMAAYSRRLAEIEAMQSARRAA